MAEWARGEPGECAVEGCDAEAAIRLDVPWDENRDVCAAHGRVWGQKEGVVALPIERAREEWDHGSGAATDGD